MEAIVWGSTTLLEGDTTQVLINLLRSFGSKVADVGSVHEAAEGLV